MGFVEKAGFARITAKDPSEQTKSLIATTLSQHGILCSKAGEGKPIAIDRFTASEFAFGHAVARENMAETSAMLLNLDRQCVRMNRRLSFSLV